jgi:hypothetical protein
MENTIVANQQNEFLFIGSLFKCNDLFLEYEKVIISKYYFSDEFCLHLYDWLSVLYDKGLGFTEKNIVIYITQSDEKLSLYKRYGGWKTIETFIGLADEGDFKSYFQTIQKYALLRELEGKGFDTSKIRSLKGFDKATTNDIYNKVRKEIDAVHTNVTSDIEVIDIGKEVHSMMEDFLERPSLGTLTFLPTYNDLFRGFRGGSMMAVGYPGNAGKTRFLAKLASYNALIKKEKCLLMLNEMTESELRLAVLTTVINNPEFQELHNVKIQKNEKEIALGIYHDDDGEFIYRKTNKEEEFIETIPEYKNRLLKTSREYRDVSLVSKWIEDNALDKYLSVVNVSKDYTDVALETCIRKNARKGFKFFAYDNLKNEKQNLGDWSALIRTTTVLSETAKSENVFVYGSIQLTDDVNEMWDVFKLNSMNIAASKGLRTVLDILVLGKEIDKDKYSKYKYIPTNEGYGEQSDMSIPLEDKGHNWKLFAHAVDKNRYGSKEIILVEVELNKNLWIERGILVRA